MATGSSKIDGNLVVTDNINCKTLTAREGGITNAAIAAAAAIAATKIQKPRLLRYWKAGTAASESVPIYVCLGATATLQSIKVGSIAIAVGSATVTVDLKKNGTTVLSAVVTLNSANTARVAVDGTITVPGAVVGDFYELVITATAAGGTIPTGLFVEVEVFEDQP